MRFQDDVERPKSAVSAADALRQHAEWATLGVEVEISDAKGNVMTLKQLRKVGHAQGT